MASARDRVNAARAALTAGFHASAASDAYYAVLYAARAALSEEDRYAKSHSGTWTIFGESFVETGRFDRKLAGRAQALRRLREAADYDALSVPDDQAEAAAATAERFVEAVAALFD